MAAEYTSCVEPADYEPLKFTEEIVVAAAAFVAAIFSGGVALLALGPIVFSAVRKALEYMLHGKLVCLGGDRCVVGWVAELEPVGFDKPLPDNIDNDYSMNILLAPSSPRDFERDASDADAAMKANLQLAQAAPVQGALVTAQPGMPEPRDAEDGFGHYHGYFSWFEGPDIGTRIIIGDKQVHIPFSKSPKGPFPVPVFHAEFEGSRPHDLLSVLDNIPPGLGGLCKVPIIGKIACAIVSAIFAPIVAVALIVAWAAADGGDPADAGDGTVEVGNLVVLNGRWDYDAGHSGWNEMHPVKTIQKLPNPAVDWSQFEDFRDRLCKMTSEAPPQPQTPGAKPAGMSPGQDTVWTAQQQPGNTWELHPDVDGCDPAAPDPANLPPIR